MTNTPEQTRVSSFSSDFDVSDFKPVAKPKATNEEKQALENTAKATGFSRQTTSPKIEQGAPEKKKVRRYTTGRNQQLNIKVTDAVMKRFYAIADEMCIPLGEVFEIAIDALEDKTNINANK